MPRLFDAFPDPAGVAAEVGLPLDRTTVALGELAFICKTVSRLNRAYCLGSWFLSTGTEADAALDEADPTVVEGPGGPIPARSWLVGEEWLAWTLADRATIGRDVAEHVVEAVAAAVVGGDGRGLRVATRYVGLEKRVEDELFDDLSVLEPHGLQVTNVEQQRWLDRSNRPDLIGELADGRRVVIELKRDAAGPDAVAQVLRYMDLLDAERPGAGRTRGLVVADGDSPEYHDAVMSSGRDVSYLAVRKLALPACRPQTHQVRGGSGWTLTVAADGLTGVAATPSLAALESAAGVDRSLLGLAYLDGSHTPGEVW